MVTSEVDSWSKMPDQACAPVTSITAYILLMNQMYFVFVLNLRQVSKIYQIAVYGQIPMFITPRSPCWIFPLQGPNWMALGNVQRQETLAPHKLMLSPG